MARDPVRSPAGWYGAAVFLVLCSAGMTWLVWYAARRHPGFPSASMDWLMIGFAAFLFLLAAGCAVLGRAFARGERWADTAVLWILACHALIGVASLAGLVAKAAGWI